MQCIQIMRRLYYHRIISCLSRSLLACHQKLLYDKFKRYRFIIHVIHIIIRECELSLKVAIRPSMALIIEISLEIIDELFNSDAAIISCVVQRELVIILLPETVMRYREHRVQFVAIGCNVHHPQLLATRWRHHLEARTLRCFLINIQSMKI